jgi:hypothetical protein
VPVHCGVRYAFVPPSGFALLWHHTFEHVPCVQEMFALIASFPVGAGAFAYPGVAASPVNGLLQRFFER